MWNSWRYWHLVICLDHRKFVILLCLVALLLPPPWICSLFTSFSGKPQLPLSHWPNPCKCDLKFDFFFFFCLTSFISGLYIFLFHSVQVGMITQLDEVSSNLYGELDLLHDRPILLKSTCLLVCLNCKYARLRPATDISTSSSPAALLSTENPLIVASLISHSLQTSPPNFSPHPTVLAQPTLRAVLRPTSLSARIPQVQRQASLLNFIILMMEVLR